MPNFFPRMPIDLGGERASGDKRYPISRIEQKVLIGITQSWFERHPEIGQFSNGASERFSEAETCLGNELHKKFLGEISIKN